jgi:mannose-1-phosphate guanylyltransferase
MAGGHGERFWPLSRPDRPKQLLKLTDSGRSMLEESVRRIEPLVSDVFVSTSVLLAQAIVPTELVRAGNVLGEPARRSTLGALAWTVASLIGRGLENATVAVVTADHAIGDDERFRTAASAALEVAESTHGLVTLGIRPTRAETGYGYIEIDPENAMELSGGHRAHRSKAFKEKPDEVTAALYLASGRHLWNGGMFFFTVQGFLREMELAAPAEYDIVRRMADALLANDPDKAAGVFLHLSDTSIDYALLERAKNVYAVPVDFPWDDVGAWDSLERTKPMDESGNVTWGPAFILDVSSCIVVNDDPERTVALVGVENLVVVNTPVAVLVCHKAHAQRVKQLVQLMGKDATKPE